MATAALIVAGAGGVATVNAARQSEKTRTATRERWRNVYKSYQNAKLSSEEYAKLLARDTLYTRQVDELLAQTIVPDYIPTFNRLLAPWVFRDYRSLNRENLFSVPDYATIAARGWRRANEEARLAALALQADSDTLVMAAADSVALPDSVALMAAVETRVDSVAVPEVVESEVVTEAVPVAEPFQLRPSWLSSAMEAMEMQEDLMYEMMVEDPSKIRYSYWTLPVPPRMKEEATGFEDYMNRSNIIGMKVAGAVLRERHIDKIHWLHNVSTSLQFSQAYISKGWYQGGSDYLSLLGNFYWDLQLNTVWHPKLLFTSTLQYRLGFNTIDNDQFRKYQISQDVLQYNLKLGYKAVSNWYYSVTGQFRTQVLNRYPNNSMTRVNSFLSPATTDVGLGMTYSKQNKKRTFSLNTSIAPFSYQMTMSVDPEIPETNFGIEKGKRFVSKMGSTADINWNWKIFKNVNYRSRMYLFSDYKMFRGDWENYFDFSFNKYFSSQVQLLFRYDTNRNNETPKESLKKWQMKEIMGVGLTYSFSTK